MVSVVVLVVPVGLPGRERHRVHLQEGDLPEHAAGALGGAVALEEAAAEVALLLPADGHAAALDHVTHQLKPESRRTLIPRSHGGGTPRVISTGFRFAKVRSDLIGAPPSRWPCRGELLLRRQPQPSFRCLSPAACPSSRGSFFSNLSVR